MLVLRDVALRLVAPCGEAVNLKITFGMDSMSLSIGPLSMRTLGGGGGISIGIGTGTDISIMSLGVGGGLPHPGPAKAPSKSAAASFAQRLLMQSFRNCVGFNSIFNDMALLRAWPKKLASTMPARGASYRGLMPRRGDD